MRIGIDIDDTLVSTSKSFDEVIKKHNVDFNKKFKDDWDKEEKEFIFKNYLNETLINAKIKENAIEVLDKLNKQGHEIIVITARTEKNCHGIEKNTKKLLEDNNIKICKYYFAQYKKSDIAKEIKLDLMIDDSLNVYKNMKDEEIDCILFDEKTNWIDVLEYINKKER